MIHDNAWGLVPDNLPDDLALWVNPALDAAGVDDERCRQAYAWAHGLLGQIDGAIIRIVLTEGIGGMPDVEIADISAGFIPFHEVIPDTSGNREQQLAVFPDVPSVQGGDIRYSFGVIIGIFEVARSGEQVAFVSEPSAFVNLYGRFPVILERRVVENAQPVHPAGQATSTCFVKPRPNKRYYCGTWTDGILLAKHVLGGIGINPGTAVSMQGGAMSTVIDVDQSTTIDAAILDAAPIGGIPAAASPIAPALAAPPGSTVTVRGRHGSFNADILRVMDDSHYFGNLVAHRVFIDSHGVQGDSGALVTSAAMDAIGLYIGKTGGAVSEGLLQSMRQVSEYFEVDLLD